MRNCQHEWMQSEALRRSGILAINPMEEQMNVTNRFTAAWEWKMLSAWQGSALISLLRWEFISPFYFNSMSQSHIGIRWYLKNSFDHVRNRVSTMEICGDYANETICLKCSLWFRTKGWIEKPDKTSKPIPFGLVIDPGTWDSDETDQLRVQTVGPINLKACVVAIQMQTSWFDVVMDS